MTKAQIKKIFKDKNIQLGKGSIELIESEFRLLTMRMAERCEMGNVKRLIPDIFWIAIGREYNK
jgi:hypothetical protein